MLTPLKALRQAEKLHDAGELDQAEALYKRVLGVLPNNSHIWRALADIELRRTHEFAMDKASKGDLTAAEVAWMTMLDHAPDYLGFLMSLVRNNPNSRAVQERVLDIDEDKVPEHHLHTYRWCLWRVLDAQGDHYEAFGHLRVANHYKRISQPYDEVKHLNYLRDIVWVYDRDLIAQPSIITRSREPVFIVGLPRSGTTLIESILGMHPDIEPLGELDTLHKLAGEYFPYSARQPGYAAGIMQEYLDRHRGLGSHFTDKMPDNSRFLGLIHSVLPLAPVLWCRRNLMDVILSYYGESFAAGHAWSYDLGELARHVVAHERMMQHWRRVGVPMVEVQYEKVVDHVESETRRILASLRLAWDPRCLDHHNAPRAVRTASISQVRQPIYKTSIARWENYQEQLKPCLTILREAQMNLGNTTGSPG